MNTKQITINPKTTKAYIQIFNGIFNLTEKEMVVLAKFVDKYQALDPLGIDVFSAEIKKQIAGELEMSDFNSLNNYIKSFKDKNVIRLINGKYKILPVFIRHPEEKGIYFRYGKN